MKKKELAKMSKTFQTLWNMGIIGLAPADGPRVHMMPDIFYDMFKYDDTNVIPFNDEEDEIYIYVDGVRFFAYIPKEENDESVGN